MASLDLIRNKPQVEEFLQWFEETRRRELWPPRLPDVTMERDASWFLTAEEGERPKQDSIVRLMGQAAMRLPTGASTLGVCEWWFEDAERWAVRVDGREDAVVVPVAEL